VRIVVVDAFERGNRGDAALLSVMLDQLRQTYPGAGVTIAGFEDPRQWPDFEGAPNLGSMRRYVGDEGARRARRVLRKALVVAVALFASTRPSRRLLLALAGLLPGEVRAELLAIAESDLVVALGGGYLNARDDLASDLSIFFLLLPLWLAQRFGVPVALGPQSYGPFPRARQRAMIRAVLGGAELVVAREDISVGCLVDAGVPADRIVRGVDSGFAFAGRSRLDWRRRLGVAPEDTVVVVTAREWLPTAQQAEYERSLVALVRHILARANHHVVLAPQVTCSFQDDDDRIVNARLADQVDSPRLHVLTDDSIDHHDIHTLYGNAQYIVGTRFHSVIFGLTGNVPCLAIEYDHKTRGIMRDLGVEEWVIRISEVRPELLLQMADSLVASREIYLAQLRRTLPGYIERSRDLMPLFRRASGVETTPSRAG
jgi:polysaccharide pyruvyl transferase WcaK-like protein